MSELKPCPFCGCKATVKKENPYDGDYVAGCRWCNIWKRGRTPEEAAYEWNKRAE